jgi:TetR/AcrR family transcriptional regulator, cholesterol catabolism regulator
MGTKEKIIQEAARLFGERGYDAVSVREIVRAAGANLGAITYHFGGKEDLLAEVVARKIAPMRAMGDALVRSGRSPEEKLRAMLRTYALYVMHEEPSLKVFFAEMLSGGKRLPESAIQGMTWRNKVFGQTVRDGIRRGIFRRCDVNCAAWIFFGMLSAYILCEPMMTGRDRQGRYSRRYVQHVVEEALNVFMNGLLVRKQG